MIVSLSDYLREFESMRKQTLRPQTLSLRKMDSESCLASHEEDLADVSHSYESASLLSSAEQSLLSGSVNAFFGISQPSSQNSSPQQFLNPKSDCLHNPQINLSLHSFHENTDINMDD